MLAPWAGGEGETLGPVTRAPGGRAAPQEKLPIAGRAPGSFWLRLGSCFSLLPRLLVFDWIFSHEHRCSLVTFSG